MEQSLNNIEHAGELNSFQGTLGSAFLLANRSEYDAITRSEKKM